MADHLAAEAQYTEVRFQSPASLIGTEAFPIGEFDPKRHALTFADTGKVFQVYGSPAQLLTLAARIVTALAGPPFLKRDDLVGENGTLCGMCWAAIEWNDEHKCWAHLHDTDAVCPGNPDHRRARSHSPLMVGHVDPCDQDGQVAVFSENCGCQPSGAL